LVGNIEDAYGRIVLNLFIDFRPWWPFTIDIHSSFGYLHHVDVSSGAEVSEAHAVSIFKADVPIRL
jgi:hypothetical protein